MRKLFENSYYPFGMIQPGRQYSATGSYRYGFNGKENDNEVKGEGNQQDYGMRIYDPRLGRFLSVDPISKSFPWYSPYQFAGNMPIAAIDLDGEEQKIMINWHDISGNVTRTKIIKFDFDNVNKLHYSLRNGLNSTTTYALEGTKFNSTNAQFTSGFEDYKKGSPTRTPGQSIRPNAGILKFDISTDANGSESVKISFDNVATSGKEQLADVLRGTSKIVGSVGKVAEGAGYVASFIPGGQGLGLSLIGIGKGLSAGGDLIDIGADLLEGKNDDAAIKFGFAAAGLGLGSAVKRIPIKKELELTKQAIDTYLGRGGEAIQDGYLNNRVQKVEESNKLDLKIEIKPKI